MSSWTGEFDILRAQIEREKENCIRQHKIDRNADAKRIVYEKVLDLIDNSIMFNGYNERSGYRKDKSNMELEARRKIHGDCKVNFEEQVQLTAGVNYRYVVDGLLPGKKPVVLEFDSPYWHSTPEQKEYDNRKDVILSNHGYRVQRIPQRVIENDKSLLMTLLLNAFYNVKNNSKKTELPTQVSTQPPPS
jgi:very-short-patch-repair endonuclease